MRHQLINAARTYHWEDNGGDWAIRAGVSRFLVAEGAGWSRKVGRELWVNMMTKHRKQKRGTNASR